MKKADLQSAIVRELNSGTGESLRQIIQASIQPKPRQPKKVEPAPTPPVKKTPPVPKPRPVKKAEPESLGKQMTGLSAEAMNKLDPGQLFGMLPKELRQQVLDPKATGVSVANRKNNERLLYDALYKIINDEVEGMFLHETLLVIAYNLENPDRLDRNLNNAKAAPAVARFLRTEAKKVKFHATAVAKFFITNPRALLLLDETKPKDRFQRTDFPEEGSGEEYWSYWWDEQVEQRKELREDGETLPYPFIYEDVATMDYVPKTGAVIFVGKDYKNKVRERVQKAIALGNEAREWIKNPRGYGVMPLKPVK